MHAALAVQMRVVGALVLRETRAAFGTSQIGYLWAVIVPAAGTALLVAVFSVIGRHPPFGASLALFFATGILPLGLFTKLSRSLMTVFEANRALLTYPPIREADVLLARALLIAATHALVMLVFYAGLAAFGRAGPPAHPLQLLAAFSATALLGFGFGTLNAVVLSFLDSWRHVEAILTRPLFFVSGIFFVPDYLPPGAVRILSWNPVLHAVEWTRNGYYANYDSRILDKPYLMGVALTLILLGLAGERLTRTRRS